MASQPLMCFALLGLGVRELSVNGRSVALVKRVVRSVSAATARDAALRACDAATAEDAEALLLGELRKAVGDAHFLRET
jgi:phosphotransferase system enzyme I (PtsI)